MITIDDLLNADKDSRNQALFGQYGMDAGGDNESGAWARRAQQPLGQLFGRQAVFANQIEPDRQAAILAYMRSMSPENINAMVDADRARLMNGAMLQGDQDALTMRGMGLGVGAQAGAQLSARNRAVEAGNESLFRASSGSGRMAALDSIMRAAGEGQRMGSLSPFMATSDLIEGRSDRNKADRAKRGIGGFVDTLAGFAGQYATGGWGGMAGGAGGGGGGGGGGGWALPGTNFDRMDQNRNWTT